MSISLALHIVGIVMWLGGLMVLTRVLALFAGSTDQSATLKTLTNKLYLGMVIPGLALVTASGLYQWLSVGGYMRQGWFHTKLTLLVVLFVVTALVGREVSQVRANQSISKSRLSALHGISALILIAVVFLTKLK